MKSGRKSVQYIRRWTAMFAAMLVALALAVPSAARASQPGLEPMGLEASRQSVAGIEQELERALAPVKSSSAPTSEVDILPQARAFYERLRSTPTLLPPHQGGGGPAPATPSSRETSPATNPLLALALRYRGVPYRWGGISRGGLDCSGLVVRAAADAGRAVPHSAALLYRLSDPVPDGALLPGDLVFFQNTYKPGISHVGIYQGGSRFLAASSGAGRVTTGDLNSPYYRRKYAGAGRLWWGARVAGAARRWLGAAAEAVVAPFRLGALQVPSGPMQNK